MNCECVMSVTCIRQSVLHTVAEGLNGAQRVIALDVASITCNWNQEQTTERMIYKRFSLVVLLTVLQSDMETSTPDGSGNNLNTSVAFQATSTPDGIGNKLNTGGSLQDGSNNAALIVGIILGIVIVALLVAFMSYVFYIRKNTMPLKSVEAQGADAPSTSNIYTVPDFVAEGAAEATYTELTTSCTPVDVSIADSSATYVNFEGRK